MSTTVEHAAAPKPQRRSWAETARAVYGIPAWLTRTIVWFPILGFVVLFAMMAIPATRERGEGLLVEDHAVENFTPVGYWVATIIGACYSRWLWNRKRRALAAFIAFVALANFGCGGEEISWGQRMFHWHTPKLFGANIQGETTIHNLPALEDVNQWFPLILGAGALILIATHTRRRGELAGIPTVIAAYCIPMVIQSAEDNYTDMVHVIDLPVDIMMGRMAEYSEMLVAFSFAIGLALAFRRDLRRERGLIPAAPPSPPRRRAD